MKLLTGKTALITGSGRGIGKAIAKRLAQEGASIILNVSKSLEEAQKTKIELASENGQKHFICKADVSDLDQIRRMMDEIRQRKGKLDLLINNAGITRFVSHASLSELTPDLFDRIYAVNLRGAFYCIQKALPLLNNAEDALVVNVASIASITAVGSNIAYCATKAGLVNMTMALARALAPKVRVNAISPGLTDTELTKNWVDYREAQIKKTPLGRLGECDDVADAVLAMATVLKYMTGHNLVVDGGRILN